MNFLHIINFVLIFTKIVSCTHSWGFGQVYGEATDHQTGVDIMEYINGSLVVAGNSPGFQEFGFYFSAIVTMYQNYTHNNVWGKRFDFTDYDCVGDCYSISGWVRELSDGNLLHNGKLINFEDGTTASLFFSLISSSGNVFRIVQVSGIRIGFGVIVTNDGFVISAVSQQYDYLLIKFFNNCTMTWVRKIQLYKWSEWLDEEEEIEVEGLARYPASKYGGLPYILRLYEETSENDEIVLFLFFSGYSIEYYPDYQDHQMAGGISIFHFSGNNGTLLREPTLFSGFKKYEDPFYPRGFSAFPISPPWKFIISWMLDSYEPERMFFYLDVSDKSVGRPNITWAFKITRSFGLFGYYPSIQKIKYGDEEQLMFVTGAYSYNYPRCVVAVNLDEKTGVVQTAKGFFNDDVKMGGINDEIMYSREGWVKFGRSDGNNKNKLFLTGEFGEGGSVDEDHENGLMIGQLDLVHKDGYGLVLEGCNSYDLLDEGFFTTTSYVSQLENNLVLEEVEYCFNNCNTSGRNPSSPWLIILNNSVAWIETQDRTAEIESIVTDILPEELGKKYYFDGDNCTSPFVCDGLKADEDGVCNNHGICVGSNDCDCDDSAFGEYSGTFCETWKCHDIYHDDERVCGNGNGICSEPDICNCTSEYVGDNCDIKGPKVGKILIRNPVANQVIGVFEILDTQLKDDYQIHNPYTGGFECSKVFEIEGGQELLSDEKNCSFSSLVESYERIGSSSFIVIPTKSASSLPDSVRMKVLGSSSYFQFEIYPRLESKLGKERMSLISFKKNEEETETEDSGEDEMNLSVSVCKKILENELRCTNLFSCEKAEKGISKYQYFKISLMPLFESDEFSYAKLYYDDLNTCESGKISKFKYFSPISCTTSSYEDSFMLYPHCKDEIMKLDFWNDNSLTTYFFTTLSPFFLLLVCTFLFYILCSFNCVMFLIQSIILQLCGNCIIFVSVAKSEPNDDDEEEDSDIEMEELLKDEDEDDDEEEDDVVDISSSDDDDEENGTVEEEKDKSSGVEEQEGGNSSESIDDSSSINSVDEDKEEEEEENIDNNSSTSEVEEKEDDQEEEEKNMIFQQKADSKKMVKMKGYKAKIKGIWKIVREFVSWMFFCVCPLCPLAPCYPRTFKLFVKSFFLVAVITTKEMLALWFASSEFLDTNGIDRTNYNFILIISVLEFTQNIIWISMGIYFGLFLLLLLLHTERFHMHPLYVCVSFGALKEIVYYRILKALFFLWFFCLNIFCFIVRYGYEDESERKENSESFNFYLSIILPQTLLLYSLYQVLSYNGVSSSMHMTRLRKLGCRIISFPTVEIGWMKLFSDPDSILEEVFQMLFLVKSRKEIEIFSESIEQGHHDWDMLERLGDEELVKMKDVFFSNVEKTGKRGYMAVFNHQKIASTKWIKNIMCFPCCCLFEWWWDVYRKFLINKKKKKVQPLVDELEE